MRATGVKNNHAGKIAGIKQSHGKKPPVYKVSDKRCCAEIDAAFEDWKRRKGKS